MSMETETTHLQTHKESMEAVKRYIHEHIGEPLQREELAALAGFSVPHFHRIFTTQFGENITRYIRRERMQRAGRKLRMGAVDITEVALAAGYETHAAFSKAFKQQFGFSPSQFRELTCNAATQILLKGKAK